MIGPPRWVESYLTIPYLCGGRNESGADCFGIVRMVLVNEACIYVPDYGDVDAGRRSTISIAFRDGMVADVWRPVDIEDAQAFDVVPMSGMVKRQDGTVELGDVHIGIMVSSTHVLHTEEESGPACEPLRDRAIARRLIPKLCPELRRHYTRCQ